MKKSKPSVDDILATLRGGPDGDSMPDDDGQPSGPDDESAPQDEDPLVVAAEDLISAIRSGDPRGVAEAFRNCLDLSSLGGSGDSYGAPSGPFNPGPSKTR